MPTPVPTPVPTTEEMRALLDPARFRHSTWHELLDALPSAPSPDRPGLAEQHHAAIADIAEADRCITVVVHEPDSAPAVTQWFWGGARLIECCHREHDVVTLAWPADGALLAARIALTAGLRDEIIAGWLLTASSTPEPLTLTTDEAAALAEGAVPQRLESRLGQAPLVTRIWSTVTDAVPADPAFDVTYVLTAHGPWTLESDKGQRLSAIDAFTIWGDVGTAITGFGDE